MITIKDMAEIAGVSPTTVANVLHGRTKKKVFKKWEEGLEGIGWNARSGVTMISREPFHVMEMTGNIASIRQKCLGYVCI